jgi:hypothetical protein
MQRAREEKAKTADLEAEHTETVREQTFQIPPIEPTDWPNVPDFDRLYFFPMPSMVDFLPKTDPERIIGELANVMIEHLNP